MLKYGIYSAGPGTDVAIDFLRSPLAYLDSLVQQYGHTVGLKLGGEHVVLTGDPGIARQVLIDRADVFVKVGRASCSCHHANTLPSEDCATQMPTHRAMLCWHRKALLSFQGAAWRAMAS